MEVFQASSRLDEMAPRAIADALERSAIVFFEHSPIQLPAENDLQLLREGLPGELKAKNLSYHPESDSVPKFDAAPDVKERVESILKTQSTRVIEFLKQAIPDMVPGWTVGTTSFRPIEERGRNLKPRSSNELVHIDAGAYGATNGDRIFRFFVNVHPTRDRVWGTKGSFAALLEEHEALCRVARGDKDQVPLRKGLLDHCYSGLVRTLSTVYPLAKVIDSSPYDRSMRRIHNYMKETPSFLEDKTGYEEIRFPPYSAWMVFTDGVSHSVLEGQHAFVTTVLIPLANCRDPDLTPYHLLEKVA